MKIFIHFFKMVSMIFLKLLAKICNTISNYSNLMVETLKKLAPKLKITASGYMFLLSASYKKRSKGLNLPSSSNCGMGSANNCLCSIDSSGTLPSKTFEELNPSAAKFKILKFLNILCS